MKSIDPILYIKIAEKEDAIVSSTTASNLFSETFGHLYPYEALDDYLKRAYNLGTTLKEIDNPLYITILLKLERINFNGYRDDLTIGYAQMRKEPNSESTELQRFYISKEYHSTGASTYLMKV